MSKRKIDLSVYFVADPSCCAGRDIIDVVMVAVRGGVSMVQYRNKSDPMPDILAEAAMLQEWLPPEVPLIINDHVDVALAVGASGVHLGQGDGSPEEAREKLGEEAIIGQTAFKEAHMNAIDPEVLDYVGTGPFYKTQTDKGKQVLGADAFAKLVELSPVPVVGIGGITPNNAAAVLNAGAQGLAMMRSISEAEDIEKAARAFKGVFNG